MPEMPEMFPPRLEKSERSHMEQRDVFIQTDPNHLRDLRHLRPGTQAQVADVAATLARGFLRLTEKRRHCNDCEPIAPLIRLDSPAQESPPVDRKHRSGKDHAR